MVFFLRDYSGSMSGKPTELVVTQHVLIYSWLLYQYAGQVESRFILHDTEAKEVDGLLHLLQLQGGRRHPGGLGLPAGQRDRREGEPGPGLQHLRLPRHRRRRLGHRGQGDPAGAREDAGLRQPRGRHHRRERLRRAERDRGGEVPARGRGCWRRATGPAPAGRHARETPTSRA